MEGRKEKGEEKKGKKKEGRKEERKEKSKKGKEKEEKKMFDFLAMMFLVKQLHLTHLFSKFYGLDADLIKAERNIRFTKLVW